MLKNIILFASLMFYTSCDCMQHSNGIVLDKNTHKPISGVYVEDKDEHTTNTETDGNGFFELSDIDGICYEMNLSFTHKNYKPESAVYSGFDTIYYGSDTLYCPAIFLEPK